MAWSRTTATGWGALQQGDGLADLPEILQKVKLPPVSDQVCAAANGAGSITDDVMICAGMHGSLYGAFINGFRPEGRRTGCL